MSRQPEVTLVLGHEALQVLVDRYGEPFLMEMRRAALNSATRSKIKGLLTNREQLLIDETARRIINEHIRRDNSWAPPKIGPELRELIKGAVDEELKKVIQAEYIKQLGDIKELVDIHVKAIEKSLRSEQRFARKLITQSVLSELEKKVSEESVDSDEQP